jgi:hypothetical protein
MHSLHRQEMHVASFSLWHLLPSEKELFILIGNRTTDTFRAILVIKNNSHSVKGKGKIVPVL